MKDEFSQISESDNIIFVFVFTFVFNINVVFNTISDAVSDAVFNSSDAKIKVEVEVEADVLHELYDFINIISLYKMFNLHFLKRI